MFYVSPLSLLGLSAWHASCYAACVQPSQHARQLGKARISTFSRLESMTPAWSLAIMELSLQLVTSLLRGLHCLFGLVQIHTLPPRLIGQQPAVCLLTVAA